MHARYSLGVCTIVAESIQGDDPKGTECLQYGRGIQVKLPGACYNAIQL